MNDTDRAAQWQRRHQEWLRLAELANDKHIADVCRQMAHGAGDMARFYQQLKRKKK